MLNSDQARKYDDNPPKPLNNATISGIDVIFTRKAKTAPIEPPTNIALNISKGLITSIRVTKIANNIPKEETIFPLAADDSLESIFNP